MNLMLPVALAAAASIFLPAAAFAETDCATYLEWNGLVLTGDEFDRCVAAGAWDMDDETTPAILLLNAASKRAHRSVFERLIESGLTQPDYGLNRPLKKSALDPV